MKTLSLGSATKRSPMCMSLMLWLLALPVATAGSLGWTEVWLEAVITYVLRLGVDERRLRPADRGEASSSLILPMTLEA